ncbi:Eco57I restriction-modification methylase domain-containing protein [Methanothrix harundinacea]|uniref:site-specific DNA-methyltransferase (adenine-specific) n=1 Tax=Methanothrix harundinacea (strain 6Ac) TaxID=1110509 RepID=G7WK96_METH6|nr:N-6 DNA methylase [Methanothrix harundinacea]AET64089.1 Type II site-specific deoxyribonuclease [Methanothrix harundinacea 6Ac]
MAVPEKILELVEKFELVIDKYKSSYKEEEIKIEFINPFFEALGWDVRNKSNNPPDQREVRFEDTLRSEGETQRPDYSFWLDRERKFFLDAKKPSVNIEGGIIPAFQIKRYAYSSTLPLAIVTDFEEFAVYDCRIKPFKFDKPQKSRLLLIKYYEYEKRWDEIASLFSKEAVQRGSLGSIPPPKGKKVDDALLEDISDWRNALAASITKMNPEISQKSLNYAVQMTIDRILFLRICEDRSIEDSERLKGLLDGDDVYKRLFELFEEADKRYNSGLFHFHPEEERNNFDAITPSIKIEDNVLKNIIQSLYYPDSPYVFSEIPADILGHVYEQFLGKVIQLDESHKVSVVEKPEVRKAGGVYYTPSYIVDYIVKNTVGKLLEGKTPKEASDLRILDPACGSGSFLIVAYQHLLDWHLDWYKAHLVPLLDAGEKPTSNGVQNLLPSPIERPGKNARSRSKKIWERASVATLPIEERAGEWHLKTAERKRILLNNIYGVDIDTQAVEVTKLSLLLKVLEGENKATITDLNMYSDERALPDLGNNIKCGNSLIGWDILEDKPDLSQEELERINPFIWEDEFKEVFAKGGFDAVIGNPPYIRIQMMKEWAPVEVEFYKEHYTVAKKGNYDVYVVFVEKGLALLNESGRLGFILPNKFFNAQYGSPLRSLLSNGKNLDEIVNFGHGQIFCGVTTYTCLIFLNKMPKDSFKYTYVEDLNSWKEDALSITGEIQAKNAACAEWNFIVGKGSDLFDRLSKMPVKLGDVAERVFQGIIPGMDAVYSIKLIGEDDIVICYSRALSKDIQIESKILRKIASGSQVKAYTIVDDKSRVIYPYHFEGDNCVLILPDKMKQDFPLAYDYLQKTRDLLDKRDRGSAKGAQWYRYIRTQNIGLQAYPKLAIPRLVHRLCAAYDANADFCLDNVDVGGVILSENSPVGYIYILGLLNSKLLNYYFKINSVHFRGGFFSANRQYIERLPIRTIDFSDPQDVTRHDKMVSLVETMLDLHKQLQEVGTPHEKTRIQNQIGYTDKQIDALVYELYDLTEEEIAIVEESTK